eukprot:TRINITY_DN17846_c0_g1_i1.p1 TRINITY_DN17846_c0_g1~~TRINITY_DN17846_c0_g1_i1.p1  ORF type:complete len:122 (+),score=7.48 TRINITY_DN17846_c0_g1_i1:269-634(+)
MGCAVTKERVQADSFTRVIREGDPGGAKSEEQQEAILWQAETSKVALGEPVMTASVPDPSKITIYRFSQDMAQCQVASLPSTTTSLDLFTNNIQVPARVNGQTVMVPLQDLSALPLPEWVC